MWTKICGNTNLDDALLAAELGADAVGFIFAPSQRRVSPQQVSSITPHLPPTLETVGVFGEPDLAFIVETVRTAKLTAVQLHFPLQSDLLVELQDAFEAHVRLVQVVGVTPEACRSGTQQAGLERQLREAFARPELFAVLLDTIRGAQSGGTGESFAWTSVAGAVSAAQREAIERTAGSQASVPHLIVAGGLRCENVAAAVEALSPWGVDVVSGVEIRPGKKSPERLSHFMQVTRLFGEDKSE